MAPPRPPVPIPFPISTFPGANPQESAGRLINCRSEPLGDTGPSKAKWTRVPGLSAFSTTSQTGYRGALLVVNLLFVAESGKLITVDSAGVASVAGNLAGTLRVTFARNNLTPTPQVACVTENGAFLVTSASVNPWPDADLPAANSVAFQDGYFFFTIGDRRVFASGINSTSIDSSTFITVQSRSSDSLLRGIAYKGLMFFFCTSSCEVWNNTAQTAPAFPYSRLAVIDRGLIGANAIAGYEDGFGQLYWVADDNGVYRLAGGGSAFTPEKVSPPDLDRLIAAVSDKTTLEASVYVENGKSIWVLSSPTWTWEFNINTEKWNERESYLTGNTLPIFTRWRGTGGTNAFGKWVVGDQQTGNLLYIDPSNQQEAGQPLRMRLESGPVDNFPNRLRVARFDAEFVAGTGIASGSNQTYTDPSVQISWSNDGGTNWGNALIRKLGEQANSKRRVTALRLGQSGSQGRRWRLDVSDPCYASFLKATMSANPRSY